jgi:hypothetical protein
MSCPLVKPLAAPRVWLIRAGYPGTTSASGLPSMKDLSILLTRCATLHAPEHDRSDVPSGFL